MQIKTVQSQAVESKRNNPELYPICEIKQPLRAAPGLVRFN